MPTITMQRERGAAQRVGGVDRDRRRVQPPLVRPRGGSEGLAGGGRLVPSACGATALARVFDRVLGPRERRDPLAQRLGFGSGSSGIVWLPAAVWTTTVESPKLCSKMPRLGVDVLDAHPRHQRAADRERAVLDVDALVVGRPSASATSAAAGSPRSRARARRAARSRAAGRARRGSSDQRSRRRRSAAPQIASCCRRQTRRATGESGRCGASISRLRARRRAARSRASPSSDSKTNGSVLIGASVAASSRRRCARWAFTRSCAASAAGPRRAPRRRTRRARRRAAWSRRRRRSARATSRSSTIASRPRPTASRSRRSSSIVSLTGISSGSATAT